MTLLLGRENACHSYQINLSGYRTPAATSHVTHQITLATRSDKLPSTCRHLVTIVRCPAPRCPTTHCSHCCRHRVSPILLLSTSYLIRYCCVAVHWLCLPAYTQHTHTHTHTTHTQGSAATHSDPYTPLLLCATCIRQKMCVDARARTHAHTHTHRRTHAMQCHVIPSHLPICSPTATCALRVYVCVSAYLGTCSAA